MNDLIIELRELGINISGSLEDQVIKVINDYFNKLQQSQDNNVHNESIKDNETVQEQQVDIDQIVQDEQIKDIPENNQDNKEIYTGAVGGYVRRAVKQHPSLWQAISKKYNY